MAYYKLQTGSTILTDGMNELKTCGADNVFTTDQLLNKWSKNHRITLREVNDDGTPKDGAVKYSFYPSSKIKGIM